MSEMECEVVGQPMPNVTISEFQVTCPDCGSVVCACDG